MSNSQKIKKSDTLKKCTSVFPGIFKPDGRKMGPAHRAYALVILGVVCFVQIFPSSNAAAVMSVDLGSEWMKVK